MTLKDKLIAIVQAMAFTEYRDRPMIAVLGVAYAIEAIEDQIPETYGLAARELFEWLQSPTDIRDPAAGKPSWLPETTSEQIDAIQRYLLARMEPSGGELPH